MILHKSMSSLSKTLLGFSHRRNSWYFIILVGRWRWYAVSFSSFIKYLSLFKLSLFLVLNRWASSYAAQVSTKQSSCRTHLSSWESRHTTAPEFQSYFIIQLSTYLFNVSYLGGNVSYWFKIGNHKLFCQDCQLGKQFISIALLFRSLKGHKV